MKKTSLFLICIAFFAIIHSCQDEFCLEATTPNLIVRFYDKDTVTKIKPIQLIVSVGTDTISNYIGRSVDSIILPINTQSKTVTYNFSILDSIPSKETLTINYEVEDIYVSKSCGFKSVFRNFSMTNSTNNWLSKSKQTTTEITNEDQAHVQIFH